MNMIAIAEKRIRKTAEECGCTVKQIQWIDTAKTTSCKLHYTDHNGVFSTCQGKARVSFTAAVYSVLAVFMAACSDDREYE